ncbi:MAG: phytoene desaturase family protein [Longimicrobiales bacterium]
MTTREFQSSRPQGSPSDPGAQRAVVIGSGFGGLALAIRLQAAGLQVTLLEKREKIGGRAYQIKDRGYVFDMGPSLITAPHVVDSVFRAAGRRLQDYVDLIPLDPYYRIYFHDGSHLDYVGDPEGMKSQMRRFNVRDAARLDAFMEAVRPIHDAVIGDRLGSKPFDSLGTMLGFLPRMARLKAFLPVTTFVNRYFSDFRHRFIFSFHPLFVGGNPFYTPAIYLMIPFLEREGGVWFTRGGMYSVVEAMGTVFQELGGIIRTGTEVSGIRVEGGRAVGVEAGDAYYPAELVVSNADVGHTYKHLVRPEHRRRWTDKKVDNTDFTMSCFLLYMGTRKQFPQLKHHTLILSERYKELLKDIFDRKILPEDFSMYLHVPTRTDPGMAPEGSESMYVLVPVANNQSGIDWEKIKQSFARRILAFLEEWGLEGLTESLEVLHLFTPDDFAGELNAFHGNAFAIEPKFTQTAWFRPHNRSEDVERLYLVGAGTHPGAGVPGVLMSAETTYGSIAEDFHLPDQWDWSQKGQVAFTKDEVSEILEKLEARGFASEAAPGSGNSGNAGNAGKEKDVKVPA